MNYAGLVKAINSATAQLQGRAAAAVNHALVIRNWLAGAWIIEFEQTGKDRAKYGARLLETLARDLKDRGIKGLDERTLLDCRSVYRLYPQIPGTLSPEFLSCGSEPRIPGTLSPELARFSRIRQTLSAESQIVSVPAIPAAPSPESSALSIRGTLTPELPTPLSPELLLRLSWSQLQELIRLDDPWQRAFYENECLKGRWSVRQLQRQIGSLLYERTGLSTQKKALIERARKQEPQETITDLLRDPYVLEFAGLSDLPAYSEDQLETALLDHLQRFLLELGRGFCFEARQFRITEGRKHHRVDLVFYHRLLRCHVLLDLKIRPFQPADAGQMNFYVNWFKARMMAPGDAPPVGILLCSDKDGAEVEFATAGMDQKLFVSHYLTALPSAEKLRAFLETDRAHIESLLPPPPGAKKPARGKKARPAKGGKP
jgi:predicted nuclease of restriction endonuclease-like (RecB) superfamily